MRDTTTVDADNAQLTVIERKTGKSRLITFNRPAFAVMGRRSVDYPTDHYLFQSGSPKNHRLDPKPINRRSVGRVFELAGQRVVPRVHLGTHSMRKTRGFALHKAGMRIEAICQSLGYAKTAVTMRYIGLDAETVRRSFTEFEL